MLNHPPGAGHSAQRRRARYSLLPLSRPQRFSRLQRQPGLKREGAFRIEPEPSSTFRKRRPPLTREGAFRIEPELSPTSMAIHNRYRKTPLRAPCLQEEILEESPGEFFCAKRDGGKSGTMDYKLRYRSPSIDSLSPPSSPTPSASVVQRARLTTVCKSPLSAAPSDARFNRTIERDPVTPPSHRNFTTVTTEDIPMIDTTPCKATPVSHDTSRLTTSTQRTTIPPLQVFRCTRRRAPDTDARNVYILSNLESTHPSVHHIRKPGHGDRLFFHPAGDSIETRVSTPASSDNIKFFHTLNLATDVKIRRLNVKLMSHYALADRALGLSANVGLTLDEFEDFCAQCAECEMYFSRKALEAFHPCPKWSEDASSHLAQSNSNPATMNDSPLRSSRHTFVSAIYDRFHAVPKCMGITAEELQYLFVICVECERVMTRTAALDHMEDSMDWQL